MTENLRLSLFASGCGSGYKVVRAKLTPTSLVD
jgi:hypothetical protein